MLIKVVPNAGYLKELRAVAGKLPYRNTDTIRLFRKQMALQKSINVSGTKVLYGNARQDLVQMTPLTLGESIGPKDLESIQDTTLDWTILVGRKRH